MRATTTPPAGALPSTACQFDMAKLLVEELHGLGIANARVDEHCYVYASIDATPGCEHLPAVGSSPTWTPPPT